MKTVSEFLSLGKSDLIKGAIMAGLGSVVTAIIVMLQGIIAVPPIYPSWQMLIQILVAGAIAGATYLLKNLFTNSSDQFLKVENPTTSLNPK